MSLPPTFPTIDISPFLSTPTSTTSPTPLQLSTATALSTACAHPGFFYLTNHNLPAALTSRVLSLAREFFLHAPAEEKERIRRRDVGEGSGDGARGYQLIGDNITEGKRDWHEGIDWYRPVREGEPFHEGAAETEMNGSGIGLSKGYDIGNGTVEREKERSPPFPLLQGLNAWPASPPNFRATYEEYITLMLSLGNAVVRAMGLALGGNMANTFINNTRHSFWVMRAIGYPPLPSRDESGSVSCGAHSDYGCVTLLLADETKGALQAWVDDDEGGEGRWVDVDPRPGALVVNIGDMMERWSGGRWKATRHRVVHRGSGYRVSVPFFFEPDWDARVPGREGEGEVVYGRYLEGKVRGNF